MKSSMTAVGDGAKQRQGRVGIFETDGWALLHPYGDDGRRMALAGDEGGRLRGANIREPYPHAGVLAMDYADLMQALSTAVADLTMRSETDAPFAVLAWPDDAPFTVHALRATLSLPPDAPLTETDLAAFFAPLTQDRDWHTSAESACVRRFQELHALLENNLHNVKVFRFGAVTLTVAIVGQTAAGRPLGLTTTVVET